MVKSIPTPIRLTAIVTASLLALAPAAPAGVAPTTAIGATPRPALTSIGSRRVRRSHSRRGRAGQANPLGDGDEPVSEEGPIGIRQAAPSPAAARD